MVTLAYVPALLRFVELAKAAAHGHHVPGTPYKYSHGWKLRGTPDVGAAVHHPEHGRGTVTGRSKTRTSVDFGEGGRRSFSHGARAGEGHFTQPTPRKPAAPKAPKLTSGEHAATLHGMKTRMEARAYVDNVRGADLRALERELDLPSTGSVDQRRGRIVEHTVGFRRNSETIRGHWPGTGSAGGWDATERGWWLSGEAKKYRPGSEAERVVLAEADRLRGGTGSVSQAAAALRSAAANPDLGPIDARKIAALADLLEPQSPERTKLDRQIKDAESRAKTMQDRLARAQRAYDAAMRDPKADALGEFFPLGVGGSGGGRRGSTDAQLRRAGEASRALDAARGQNARAEARLKELTARREAAGKFSQGTVSAGDAVKVDGQWWRVKKANPKTVQIDAGPGFDVKYPWGRVTDHRSQSELVAARRPKPAARSADEVIRQAYSDLYQGRHTEIPAEHLDGLMEALVGQDPNGNLSMVNVGGYPNLFQRHLRDIPRDQMPQMGTEIDQLHDFISELVKSGVEMHFEEIDPTSLVATQSQLSGAKVAKLYGFMKSGGWLRGGVMLVSTEPDGSSAVVDGHHRWAAAAAVRASGVQPGMNVTALRIGMPIDDILEMLKNAPKEALETDREA